MNNEVADELLLAVLPEDVATVKTRRQAAHRSIVGTTDHRDVVAQSGSQFQHRQLAGGDAHFLLSVQRHIIHCRQLVVAVFTPGRGIAHILVVGASSVVLAARQLSTSHQSAHDLAEAMSPVGLQTYGIAQGLGVLVLHDVPVARRS